MTRSRLTSLVAWSRLVLLALAMGPCVAAAQAPQPSPYAIDIPSWFAETFLDFREDVADAARDHKRLLVYFGQDGCPYCRQLMVNNFSQRRIVDKTRAHFVAIALNIWGDRETTWLDGKSRSEKELARFLEVQFTPTLLFFDERGNVVARLNGYYPPDRFEAVLDYVADHRESTEPLRDYLARHATPRAGARLNDETFFLAAPLDLATRAHDKPLAVLFETADCAPCDELHRDAFRRPEVLAQLQRFDVVRFGLAAPTMLTTRDGRRVTAREWARELDIAYVPTLVLFAPDGREALRVDAYLRAFHLASALEYVAGGAYREEPSFQRYIQTRAQRLRDRGQPVELWE
ncbi:MAG TPA: thioredoxin fold domain-containing protein [Casimicrobiaceae bacterium]|nr:thioredoxin fold domain-containing protein [Casimicrobiaceae bacterium]